MTETVTTTTTTVRRKIKVPKPKARLVKRVRKVVIRKSVVKGAKMAVRRRPGATPEIAYQEVRVLPSGAYEVRGAEARQPEVRRLPQSRAKELMLQVVKLL